MNNHNYKSSQQNISHRKIPTHNNKVIQKKNNKDKRDVFLARVLFFLIVFALLTTILIICIGCKHNQNANTTQNDDLITVDKGEEKPQKEVSLSAYNHNGIIYVNFTELAQKCNMTISGTEIEQTFSVQSNDKIEYMTVKADSNVYVINGETIHASHNAIIKDSNIWLSIEFVSNAVNGITVKYDSESKILTCKRKELNASTKDNPLYEQVSFTYNVTTPIETQKDTTTDTTSTETQKPQTPTQTKYKFKADLSSYEQYMEPANRDGYLIIANRDILLSSDFVPKDLTKVQNAPSSADKYKMTYVAAMAFEALVKEAAANGYTITPKSGYRSYSTQKYLFQNYVNGHIQNDNMTYAEAFAYASTYSMIEGASEHQTGLTMDVNELEQTFGNTPEGKWLAANCYKFGFIIRYPQDKEDKTGISWEPWHIRYVGRYHAEQMRSLKMCLEEYLVHINKMPIQ